MDAFSQAIHDKKYDYAASIAHKIELERASRQMYEAHILCLLLADKAAQALVVWGRMPDEVKNSEFMKSVQSLAVCLDSQDMPSVFPNVSGAQSATQSQMNLHLLELLLSSVRTRTLALLERSYSSIRVDKCCQMLGSSRDEVVQCVIERGWSISGDNDDILVVACSQEAQVEAAQSYRDRIVELTSYAKALE